MHRHLEGEGRLEDDEHRAEVGEQATTALRNQILLDTLAEQLEIKVSQNELLDYLVNASRQYGMDPNTFIQTHRPAGPDPDDGRRGRPLEGARRRAAPRRGHRQRRRGRRPVASSSARTRRTRGRGGRRGRRRRRRPATPPTDISVARRRRDGEDEQGLTPPTLVAKAPHPPVVRGLRRSGGVRGARLCRQRKRTAAGHGRVRPRVRVTASHGSPDRGAPRGAGQDVTVRRGSLRERARADDGPGRLPGLRPQRLHLQPTAPRAHHLARLRGARRERQRHLRADDAARRGGPGQGHLAVHQLARWLDHRGHGDLRHHAVHPAGRRHDRDGHGGLDGAVPALVGRQGQALRDCRTPA